ncbi:hypothetical protein BJ742DRAFT_748021 [Cladochytrium replicatum]|nr:hypothetical protein BJ742DRAFT_748021 [Cladochytrium replicatum]
MKVLVTGASGALGRQVFKCVKDVGHDVLGTAYSRAVPGGLYEKVDLTNTNEAKALFEKFKPHAVVHCAAERKPDEVDKNPEGARLLNVGATRLITELCKSYGAFLIYISSDYVFDGTSPPYEIDSKANPINFYGQTKFDGELVVKEVDPTAVLLRIPVLYGPCETPKESAVNLLVDLVKDVSKPVKMDHVQVRYPTNTIDVARVCRDLIVRAVKQDGARDTSISGVYQFSAKEKLSKYEMCEIFAGILNVPIAHIEAVVEQNKVAAVTRPHDCQLSTARLESEGFDVSYVPFKRWFEGWIPSH